MQVPYFDLKAQYRELREEFLAALDRVCQNSSFILGEEVERFEQEFAEYCQVKHCVALNTGTSALHLGLLAVGVKDGNEVITSANTFIATAEAISYTGAKPVFVDIDAQTANISPLLIEQAITPRTKAIVPVHLYGRPAQMDAILKIAESHHLALIEDACQAHGARFGATRIGGFGKAAAFSFYPGKNLGAYGEGGALTTNDDQVAQFCRAMRDHGQVSRYFHDYVGYNYRMDGFQGAVLRVKLRHLPAWTRKRQEVAALYRQILAASCAEFPQDSGDAESVYHLFVVWADNRDAVRKALEARGVHTAIHYPRPLHLQKAYAFLGHSRGSFPHTERACDRVFSMPLFPEMTSEQARYAAETVAEVLGQK